MRRLGICIIMKLSKLLFENENSLNENAASENLLKDIQPAIGKAIQDYNAQIKNLQAAMVKDFGADLLASDFFDVGLKLIRSGKSREGYALQNFPRQSIQSVKERLPINTKNPRSFDNKLKGLKRVLLSQMGARASQGTDTAEGGLAARSQNDVEARMTNKTEEGKALRTKMGSLRSDQEKEEYVKSKEFKDLIQKVDPKFMVKAKGMAKVNPKAVVDIDGFRILANKLLENKKTFILEQESTLDGFIWSDFDGTKNTISSLSNYFEKANTGTNTIAALKNLAQTIDNIKASFKSIKVPGEISKAVKQDPAVAAAPAAPAASAASAAPPLPPEAAQKQTPPPDTNKLAADIFGSIPPWKDYITTTPFGQTVNQMKDYVAKLSKETDPEKAKGPKEWLKANFKKYMEDAFNQFLNNPQHAQLKGNPMLKSLQTSLDQFVNQVATYASGGGGNAAVAPPL